MGGSGTRGAGQDKRKQRGVESEGKKAARRQKKRARNQAAEQTAKEKFVARVARVAAGQPTANFAGAVAEGQTAHDDTREADNTSRASRVTLTAITMTTTTTKMVKMVKTRRKGKRRPPRLINLGMTR